MARLIALYAAIEEERLERKRRRLCLREDFFLQSLPDTEFVNSYRLTRTMFEELCTIIVPLLPEKKRSHSVDPVSKILAALSFYARGSYQGQIGQNYDAPMAQQTVSRCLEQVTEALNSPEVIGKFVKFPQNSGERNQLKSRFYQQCGIPGLIGLIDCSHIAIIRPNENEERFLNRKHYHSLNAQFIVDLECNVLNVDVAYGGATHDAFIWAQHDIKRHLEDLHHQGDRCILLGDSGYPLRPYLITPFDSAQEGSLEANFNRVHKSTRSTVERTFGILKGRWRCLLAARELHYTPTKAAKIVIACCVLHNMCNRGQTPVFELSTEDIEAENRRAVAASSNDSRSRSATAALNEGRLARRDLMVLLERRN